MDSRDLGILWSLRNSSPHATSTTTTTKKPDRAWRCVLPAGVSIYMIYSFFFSLSFSVIHAFHYYHLLSVPLACQPSICTLYTYAFFFLDTVVASLPLAASTCSIARTCIIYINTRVYGRIYVTITFLDILHYSIQLAVWGW